jgi:hypothetical protein
MCVPPSGVPCDDWHAGATCLDGEGHTLPSRLPPGAGDEEGDSAHASVMAQLRPESVPFPDTRTDRLSVLKPPCDEGGSRDRQE